MGLENARDSIGNLLNFKQESEGQPFAEGGIQPDAQTSFHLKEGCTTPPTARSSENFLYDEDLRYEPYEVGEEDEEHWPLWEMTGDETKDMLNIGECERVFAVPEVYEDFQCRDSTCLSSMVLRDDAGDGSDRGPCENILSCLNPWEQPTTPAVHTNPQISTMIFDSMNDMDGLDLKGAIKRSSMAVQLYLGMPLAVRQSFVPSMYKVHSHAEGAEIGASGRRRFSIHESDRHQKYAEGATHHKIIDKDNSTAADNNMFKVHFSELKTVLRVPKLTPEEAMKVWFQKEHFALFKKEMALLIKQEAAASCEVWLGLDAEELERKKELSERSEGASCEGFDRTASAASVDGPEERSSSEASWWHNYDHSRRGLERYVSPGQAFQILASTKVAVNKVMEEQRRQYLLRCLRIPGATDPQKIATVYHAYTAWSRDLALAAGASDADAVRTGFDDAKRHSREYYILKQVVQSGYKVHKFMPEFMLPTCITPRGFLDESRNLYIVNGGPAVKTNFLQLLAANVPGVGEGTMSGEEARKKMSKLDTSELGGPMPPTLAVSLEQSEKGRPGPAEKGLPESKSPMKKKKRLFGRPQLTKEKSLSERAQNFPFQE